MIGVENEKIIPVVVLNCKNKGCKGLIKPQEQKPYSQIRGCRIVAEETFRCSKCNWLHWGNGDFVTTNDDEPEVAVATEGGKHIWKKISTIQQKRCEVREAFKRYLAGQSKPGDSDKVQGFKSFEVP